MMKPVVSALMLITLLFFEGISIAGEIGASSPDEAILVVSKSIVSEQTEGTNRDQQLAIDAKLKQSISKKLKARGLNVASDDGQKLPMAPYVLAYNLVSVKFGMRHLFGRSAKVTVDYVFQKNGEPIASGQIAAKSKAGWKKCVHKISDDVAAKIAAADTGSRSVTGEPAAAGKSSSLGRGKPDKRPPEPEADKLSARASNAVSLGVSGFMTDAYDDYGYAFSLSHEATMFRLIAVYAKIGYMAYQCGTESYFETARGTGAEIGARFYPGKHQLPGWYVGLGVGRWSVEGPWNDDRGTPFVTTGKGKTVLTAVNIHTGYKIFFRSHNFYLDPSLQVDTYGNKGAPGSFGQLGLTLNAAVAAGITW